MRKAGYYWVQFHDYGSVRAVLWKKRTWLYDQPVTDADLTVMVGPLPMPSAEELAGHEERLAGIVADDWQLVGCDPRRDGHHVDGVYWVQFPGGKPFLAELFEDGWWALEWYDGDPTWSCNVGKGRVPVIFGPLDRPLGRHRRSAFVQGLIDAALARQAARAEVE